MELIQNKPQKLCEVCYYHDRIGVKSKRVLGIEYLYDRYIGIVKESANKGGQVSSFPKWLELRFSSDCNLACRICSPRNSSKFLNELSSYKGSLPGFIRTPLKGLMEQKGNLSDSVEFMNELMDHIADVDFIELHGGEPFINKSLWRFLETVAQTEHARRIKLFSHCNLTHVSDGQIEILNAFAGGMAKVSIDAFQEENEFLRWSSHWKTTEEHLPRFGRLHKGFEVCIGTSLSVYQACTIDKLFVWIDGFLQAHPNMRVTWLVWPVVKPDYFRVDLVPKNLRHETVERIRDFAASCFSCTDYINAQGIRLGVEALIALLTNDSEVTARQLRRFAEYTRALDRVRNQNSASRFPHLELVLKQVPEDAGPCQEFSTDG